MIFMKLKSIPMILTLLLFIVSMFEFVRIGKLQKLVYPLIVIYFLVVMPIIVEFIDNRVLYITFVILNFVIAMIFLYRELTISNKEKNLKH